MLLYIAILIGLTLFASRESRKHGKPSWMFWLDFGFGSVAGSGLALFLLARLSVYRMIRLGGDILGSDLVVPLFIIVVAALIGGLTWGWTRSRW